MTSQRSIPLPNTETPVTDFYHFPHAFSSQEIKRILEYADQKPLVSGVAGAGVNKDYRSSKVSWLPANADTDWLYAKSAELIGTANYRMWNCDLHSLTEDIQFGRYSAEENGKYDYHLDVGQNNSNRKLSMVVQLDRYGVDFEGGEFEFLLGKDPVRPDIECGDVIVFPTYLLHRVLPLTSGTRRSLVTWAHGPAWR